MRRRKRKQFFETNIRSLMRKKAAEEDRPITQEVMARELKIGTAVVSRWTNGEMRVIDRDTLTLFQDYFNCTIEELIIDYKGESVAS